MQSEILFRLPSRSLTVRLQKKGESRTIYDAGWSSLVARRAHNPEVVGSNPTPATNLIYEGRAQAPGLFCFATYVTRIRQGLFRVRFVVRVGTQILHWHPRRRCIVLARPTIVWVSLQPMLRGAPRAHLKRPYSH